MTVFQQMIRDGSIPFNVSMLNGDMSKETLQIYAHRFSMACWGVPFTGEVEIVPYDWKRKLGRFLCEGSVIKFSKKMNGRQTMEEVLKTLLHELVHWRLHTTGKPAGDDSREFVEEAIRVGASFSGTQAAIKAVAAYGQ